MAKKHECPEPENAERWAVSYLDMITVMMCLFLVLYAISQVDNGKLAKLRASLAAGFNNTDVANSPIVAGGGLGVLSGSTSAVALGKYLGNSNETEGIASPERLAAQKEVSHLEKIEADVESALAAQGLGKALEYRITEKGLVLGMVANDTFFKPGDATIEAGAQQVLAAIAPALAGLQEQIAIEGYADPNPQSSAKYPNNDYLSSARANEVLVFLKNHGVPGSILRSTSYGADHQTEASEGQDGYALNRRVDIVILSNAKESVRELLTEAAAPNQLPTPVKDETTTVH